MDDPHRQMTISWALPAAVDETTWDRGREASVIISFSLVSNCLILLWLPGQLQGGIISFLATGLLAEALLTSHWTMLWALSPFNPMRLLILVGTQGLSASNALAEKTLIVLLALPLPGNTQV